MWIFTPVGFVSVVFASNQTEVMFRFRTSEDADSFREIYTESAAVVRSPDADYRFRIVVEEELARQVFERLIAEFFEKKPRNVKATAVQRPDYRKMMSEVWNIGFHRQHEQESKV